MINQQKKIKKLIKRELRKTCFHYAEHEVLAGGKSHPDVDT